MYIDFNRVYALHAKLLSRIARAKLNEDDLTTEYLLQISLAILRFIEQKISVTMMLDDEDVRFVKSLEDELG